MDREGRREEREEEVGARRSVVNSSVDDLFWPTSEAGSTWGKSLVILHPDDDDEDEDEEAAAFL